MQHSGDQEKMFYFVTGCTAGAVCVGMYYWYADHEARLLTLEEKMEESKKTTDNHHFSIKDIKHTQDEEEKRLNQTREWVKEEQETRQTTIMKHLDLLSAQDKELKQCIKRITQLEEVQQFHSIMSSSSTE